MSSWIDNDYAIQYFSLQPRYKLVSSLPMRLNCRCPVCGDSVKDKFKARFWFYYWKNAPMVHCYNCDYSSGFSNFLKEYDEDLFNEYQMEKFKESASGKKPIPKKVEVKKEQSKVVNDLVDCTRIDLLPETHPIIKYVENRKIPKAKWDRLWFTSKWQHLCNKINEGTFENPKPEHRLVIPIRNAAGKIESFQGRSLVKNSKIKYMTIKADENSTKIYGQDTIDDSIPHVMIFEGPIDSLFVENGLAITGGSLSLDVVPYKDRRIWVLDNEPRHPDTIKRMNKLIEAGEKVCFWDAAPWKSKDINDMVKNENADPSDIQKYILDNSESGLMAKVRMIKFCKI